MNDQKERPMTDRAERQVGERLSEQAPTLEELLERGEVKSALLLKGEFTERERDLMRQAWEAGLAAGARQLAEAEQRVKELLPEAALAVTHMKYHIELVERTDQAERVSEHYRETLDEASAVIHAEGYDDPEDKLRSLAVIVGLALDTGEPQGSPPGVEGA